MKSTADVNLWAVLVAAVLAFVIGAVYYVGFGARLAQVGGGPAADSSAQRWAMPVEALRCLVLAAVVAGVAAHARVDTWTGGLLLGLVLWVGFPLVLWVGAMVHENTRWQVALIHAGDWLLKLLLMGLVVAVWQ